MARSMLLLQFSFIIAIFVPASVKADLTVGTEFIFAFPCFNVNVSQNGMDLEIWIQVVNTNSNPAALNITSSILNFAAIKNTVPGNDATEIQFNGLGDDGGVCEAGKVTRQGYNLQSSMPVSLFVYLEGTFGGQDFKYKYIVLPSRMLGSRYVGYNPLCNPNTPGVFGGNRGIITALNDGTRVALGGDVVVTLNRLETYSTCALNISSNMPFALSLLFSMALPSKYAFTEFVLPPPNLTHFDNFVVQIWASEDNTQVSISGSANITLNAGSYYNAAIGNGGGTIMTSKPVNAIGMNNGTINYAYATDNYLSGSVQFFVDPDDGSQLVIMAPLASTGNILLDGKAIPGLQYRRIQNSSHYFYIATLTGPSQHTISTTTPSDRYMANVILDPRTFPIAMDLPNLD